MLIQKCIGCLSPCVEGGKKISVHAKRVLACIYSDSLPSGNLKAIIDSLQATVFVAQKAFNIDPPSIQTGALNNARGHWLKWIFVSSAWNYFIDKEKVSNACFVMLPSTTSLNFVQIFDPEAQAALKNGLLKNLQNQNIEMTMSNPDFICVTDLTPNTISFFRNRIVNLSIDSQQLLDTAYKQIIDSCSYSSLKFGVALKTSLRSDRRYQTAYEGSILKALIAHLQVRFWDTAFSTRYYAVVADKVTRTDYLVLSAPATHSIVDVHTQPVKAIDKIYQISSTQEILQCIDEMVNNNF